MEHSILQSTLSHSEREYLDLMRHGDNFFKIELLRPAKSYYKKALQLNIETDKVKQRIEECDRLLDFEIKVIWILVIIAACFVLAFIFL